MEELLSNPAVQAALVVAIVTGLNMLVAWLKSRFPTQVALVDANWCYIQPLVIAVMDKAKAYATRADLDAGAGMKIVLSALAEFEATYQKLENKLPTAAEMNAAREEFTAAINRVVK